MSHAARNTPLILSAGSETANQASAFVRFPPPRHSPQTAIAEKRANGDDAPQSTFPLIHWPGDDPYASREACGQMPNFAKSCCLSLVVFNLPIAVGCGSRDGTTPPTASISAPDGDRTRSPATPTAADKPEPDKLHPVAVIHTTLGDITVRLDAEHAPISVDSFLAYAEKGHYDNTLFHQVFAKPAVILGGGFDTFQKERPADSPIRNEAHNGLKNVRGTIGMTRSPNSIDSSTSQFYINSADNPQLDHRSNEPDGYGYCVFGEVTSGMEVVDRIAHSAVHDTDHLKDTPVEQVIVKWIHIGR